MIEGVVCAGCGTQAGPGQRFCGSCGTPLAAECANCGTNNPPGQRFCGSCGTPLVAGAHAPTAPATVPGTRPAAPPPTASVAPAVLAPAGAATGARADAPAAERRLVSVLFADLVGFTTYAEGRDSEEVRETLTRYFDTATEVITRFGGVVEKFIGDAVMAVWGAPTVVEDDAERAVRAALELLDAVRALGVGIEARAGVLTGEAAVTLGATNQGMVAGDLVNTASRLQSAAAPSTVLVGESTFRAASGAIVFEPAGEQALKGKGAPVTAWRAVRVVAERGGRNRADALEAPFVGRDVELRLLKELFHATGTEQRMRHVSVVGSGGVGKSRLAWEFEKYLDGIEERIWWHHGRSPAYGQGITFWSLGEMIRSRAGLAETDNEDRTRSRIADMLDVHMSGHVDRPWVESALLQLLGIPSGLPADELFGAWRTFFDTLAATGTVVLVFQDIQWADSGTLDFVDHLAEWSRGLPIMILTLARPELLEHRPDWGTARRGFTSVFLEPLPESAMRELITGLVPDMPERMIEAIVRRAEGVPLYAIETVRMLVNDARVVPAPDGGGTFVPAGDLADLAELAVPETLTGLIAARLDALDALDRSLVLDAAVLGQSFTPAALVAISGRETHEVEGRLRVLLLRELLTHVVDPRSPERGQYQFVQALIREVAYNTLAKKDRKVRHLAAARWFESLGEPELVGALAGHYLAARALASEGAEADALAAQARIALKAAGERAASLASNKQAINFYEQALAITNDPAEQADLHERVGVAATIIAELEVADDHLARGVALRVAAGDRSAAASLIALRGTALNNHRRFDQAAELLEPALAEYADLGKDPGRLRLVSQLARTFYLRSEHQRAIAVSEEVLAVAEQTDELLIVADTLITKGGALANLGRKREGLGVMDVGIRIAELNGFTTTQLRGLTNRIGRISDEDPREAWDAVASAMAMARRYGERGMVHSFAGTMGFMALRAGEWASGETTLESGLADTTDQAERVLPLGNLVNLRAVLGKPFAVELAEMRDTASSDPRGNEYVLESEGWIALAAGRVRDARTKWRELATTDPLGSSAMLEWASHMSLWLNEPDEAMADVAGFWAHVPHGGVVETTRDAISAGLAGLRGERGAAVAGFRAAASRLAELRLPIDDVFLAIDMIYTLGPSEPFVAESASRARATLTRLKATPLLELLDEAIAHGAHEPAHGTRSGSPGAGARTRASSSAAASDSAG